MYFAFAAIYYVLVLAVIVDVLRQPASALSGVGKALWIVAFLVVPVLPVACLRLLAHQAIAPVEGVLTLTVINPATEEPIAELEQAGVEEADEAVARAKEAFPAWRAVAPADRGAPPSPARDARRGERRGARSDRVARTSASRSPERAARSAWSRRSSTSTPAPSTSTAARRSPWPAESLRRSASRSASSGSSSRGTSPRTSRAGSSGRRSRAGTRSSSSRPS